MLLAIVDRDRIDRMDRISQVSHVADQYGGRKPPQFIIK